MEKQTVYIKVKISDRLPLVNGEYYCIISNGKCGNYFFDGSKFESTLVKEWFEAIELPSEKTIDKQALKLPRHSYLSFRQGANFILNKLKGETK